MKNEEFTNKVFFFAFLAVVTIIFALAIINLFK